MMRMPKSELFASINALAAQEFNQLCVIDNLMAYGTLDIIRGQQTVFPHSRKWMLKDGSETGISSPFALVTGMSPETKLNAYEWSPRAVLLRQEYFTET
ncbi:unnamed protein product [Didymodactylos carnosus]|uniref:Uncharacterized protein n=1 Tax=Didymodactylos carnosus TaxID=1234261 RepID=A0A813V7W9_9BILA|nr:unnamed protein product [Didymodactylos carnosus]CAF0832853.1 unnamed protein product [Didymodactylos carnosus]CAF3596756.1 unnamed protein product [Didymodactylos carnosus]CAF3619926.1 unnamed protein product [Didymodactylos carnosus]